MRHIAAARSTIALVVGVGTPSTAPSPSSGTSEFGTSSVTKPSASRCVGALKPA